MRHLFVLIKIFILLECVLSGMVLCIWLFFGGLSYITNNDFQFDVLIGLLKGVTIGTPFMSLVYWFFYYLIPNIRQ
jgi:hypothetical protein